MLNQSANQSVTQSINKSVNHLKWNDFNTLTNILITQLITNNKKYQLSL